MNGYTKKGHLIQAGVSLIILVIFITSSFSAAVATRTLYKSDDESKPSNPIHTVSESNIGLAVDGGIFELYDDNIINDTNGMSDTPYKIPGGSNQTLDPPMHQYTSPPTYVNAGKDIATYVGQKTVFSAMAFCPDYDEIQYSWDFDGDKSYDCSNKGNSGQTIRAFYTYDEPGIYSVKLGVTNLLSGVTTSDDVTVYVKNGSGNQEYVEEIKPEISLPKTLNTTPEIEKYVVMINGGAETRFWEDVEFTYNMLIDDYGFTPENIILLNYGGTNPQGENPGGMIDYPATHSYIEQVFAMLAQVIDNDDLLFVWVTDHGMGYFSPASPYYGFLYGYDAPFIDPGDEMDYLESDFKLRSFTTYGDYWRNIGMDVWGANIVWWDFLYCYAYYRVKYVSSFSDVYFEDIGSTASDHDVYIEKFVDYLQGDYDQDGYLEENMGEVYDYDGDGIPPYDPSTGVFDEGDWGAIHHFENVNGINTGVPQQTSGYYRIFDAGFDNHVDIDLNYQGGALEVDGTDLDNSGLFDGMDINEDGDMNDWVSIDEQIYLNNDPHMRDDELKLLLDNIPAGTIYVVLEPCFSGGFIWDLNGPNRIICSATVEEDYSWGNDFIRGITSAFHGKDINGNPVNADSNGDGQVSVVEAFNYAASHDSTGELPQYDDNGDGVSHEYPIPSGGDGQLGSRTFLSMNPPPITPYITFIQDDLQKTLTVTSADTGILWSNLSINGTCNISGLGNYVLAGDQITNCQGIIVITYTPTDKILGVFIFTPVIHFVQDDFARELLVAATDSGILWSDIDINGTCNTSALGTYVMAGDVIRDCYGNIVITYIPTGWTIGVFTFPPPPIPDLVYVDNGYNESTPGWGYTHFNTIQDGVNAVATYGDVIVYEGSYPERIDISTSLELLGENKTTTIIDGGGYGTVVDISADHVNISGFTIREGQTGISVRSNDNNISGNIIINNYYGIDLDGSLCANTIVSGNIITNITSEISIGAGSHNNIISDNTVNNTLGVGIYLYGSNYTIRDNTFESNGIFLEEHPLNYWNTHSIENNTLDGKPIRYYKNIDGITVPENTAQVILGNCTNVTIEHLEIGETFAGIQLGYSSYNTIARNDLHSFIFLVQSNDNTITKNLLRQCFYGYGILLENSQNNRIVENTIANISGLGMSLLGSTNNAIYHNNFINNTENAIDDEINTWNDSYTSGGNYWSDYSGTDFYSGPGQNILGSDGIGDTPYDISGGSNQDHYPSMIPDGWLYPPSDKNPIICGYVTDALTTDPLPGATLDFYWTDNQGHDLWDITQTNDQGFYLMGVPAGTIDLYFSAEGYFPDQVYDCVVGMNEIVWINISLTHYPVERSVICGYITDSMTAEPIANVFLDLYWHDNEGHQLSNNTYGDDQGFYQINVPAGTVDFFVSAEGYYSKGIDPYMVGENEIVWMNMSLTPYPEENSVICGFVVNAVSAEPIGGVHFYLYWYDSEGHSWSNSTQSDDQGFYLMGVPAGTIDLYFSAEGYFPNQVYDYVVGMNEIVWMNMSLIPYPEENSVVCGFVVNAVSAEPVEGVHVDLYWYDSEGHSWSNSTESDDQGFYLMGVPAGTIVLYFFAEGYYSDQVYDCVVGVNEIVWMNMSLIPYPEENAVVCGYVVNSVSAEPIEGVHVDLYWHDNEGNYLYNYTYSDEYGFYQINVPAGTIDLYFSSEGYYSKGIYHYVMGTNEIVWMNMSLIPYPEENAVVCGYVTDADTAEPISNAYIQSQWKDNEGHDHFNTTESDDLGFYRMNVAAGSLLLRVSAYGYTINYTSWNTIEDYQMIWFNFTLEADSTPPTISNITVPEYVGVNHPGDIGMDVVDDHLSDVEFYIMDENMATFNQPAAILYYLNLSGISGRYTLYNYSGCYWNMCQKENSSPVMIFFLSLPHSLNTSAYLYVDALFKKNQTSDMKEVFLEFSALNGSLMNIGSIEEPSLDFDYITNEVESGVSIVYPVTVFGDLDDTPYTLYLMGNPLNPSLRQSPLNNGTYSCYVWASDKAGHHAEALFNVTVLQINTAPFPPSTPIPADGAIGIEIHPSLSWTGGDPDVGDTVTYDVYFGNTSSPPKVIANQSSTICNLETLTYSTTYYWQIIAWDNHGTSTPGSLWSFTTEPQPVQPPTTPIHSEQLHVCDHPSDMNKGIGKIKMNQQGGVLQQFNTTSLNFGTQIYYKFYFGDNTDSGWLGPCTSGQVATTTHDYNAVGTFNVTATCKIGLGGTESSSSDIRTIRMYLNGDTSGNDILGFEDINPFVLILSSGKNAYYTSFLNGYYYTGDINEDGQVDFGDINPFVALLSGG